MSSIPVIELDPASGWEPPERPIGRRTRAATAVLAVLVLAVAAFVLNASGAGGGTLPLYSIGGGNILDFTIGDGGLFTRASEGSLATVRRYRLSDGAPMWTVGGVAAGQLRGAVAGRVMLAQETNGGGLIALDGADGHEVWKRPDVFQVFPGGYNRDPVLVEPVGQLNDVLALDARTGNAVWSDHLKTGSMRTYDITGDRMDVAALDRDGTLTVRDSATGAVTRTARLVGLPDDATGFELHNDLLLTYTFNDSWLGHPSVFDLNSGRQLWSRLTTVDSPVYDMRWCGNAICMGDPAGTTAVDPQTGAELWRYGGEGAVNAVDTVTDRMYSSVVHQLGDGSDSAATEVLDAHTGRVTLPLPGWRILTPDAWPTLVAVEPLDSRTGILARVDALTGTVEVFGRFSPLYSSPECRPLDGYVICQVGLTVQVWRIPDRR